MTSSMKRVNNFNRLRRPQLSSAAVKDAADPVSIFEANWDELVIRFDPRKGDYSVITARSFDSEPALIGGEEGSGGWRKNSANFRHDAK